MGTSEGSGHRAQKIDFIEFDDGLSIFLSQPLPAPLALPQPPAPLQHAVALGLVMLLSGEEAERAQTIFEPAFSTKRECWKEKWEGKKSNSFLLTTTSLPAAAAEGERAAASFASRFLVDEIALQSI